MAASVTANGHTITKVQFYNGSTLLGEDTVSPYSWTWSSVIAGSYVLKARVVYDGGSTRDSATVSITVTNPLPTIALTSPLTGKSYDAPGTVNLAASVVANGHTISKVQFYNGATLLGEDTASPYSLIWSNVNPGNYTLSARLIYDTSSIRTSSSASISVIGLPAPWRVTDIGSVGLAGSASMTNGLYRLNSVGTINGTADDFSFVYQPLTADGQMQVRLNSVPSGSSNIVAGIMVRETLADDSKYIFIGLSGTSQFVRQNRTTTGGAITFTRSSTLGTPPNVWLLLVRSAKKYTAYYSLNGTGWTGMNPVGFSIDMATNSYFGIVVTSGSSSVLRTATFIDMRPVP